MQEGFPQIVNIQDDILRLGRMGVLEPLLADKTTSGNILWATDAYAERGPQYEPTAEITSSLISGPDNAGIIQTRARKAFEQQSARTRQRAEVYSPLWLVKMMCDHIDKIWFKRRDGFNKTISGTNKIYFNKNRTWTAYIKSIRMEITCGEAPFLVSRYDAPTGNIVAIQNRVGMLDRKLRVVSENTDNEEDWLKWARVAYQSIYGFELQGDSLLIARVNALMSFIEYYVDRWGHFPKPYEYNDIIDIVVWNIWEMDGLTSKIPYRVEECYSQMSLDDLMGNSIAGLETPQLCRVYDWHRRQDVEYYKIREKGAGTMKFDYIIGNPPYQEDNDSNNRKKPVYDRFMDESYGLADVVELITPARFLFNAGYTSKEWNQKMLNDEHFSVLYYEPDRDKVFPNTDIKGGVAVSIYNHKKDYGKIVIFTPYKELNSILHKVLQVNAGKLFLSDVISARGMYRFTPSFFHDYPDAPSLLGKGTGNMIASNAFEKLPDVFLENVPEGRNNTDYLKMMGLVRKSRVYRYIKKEYVVPNDYIPTFNVLFPKANGSGEFGEILTLPEISDANTGATDTFINIGMLSSKDEAVSAVKYIKTKFMRSLLGIKKVTQDCPRAVWQLIPLQDFSAASDINWAAPIPEIDQQLYKKYGLDEKEIEFIESHVKEMT